MMDMRPEDFPKKELDFEEISGGLNRLNDEQLYKLESWIQDLRERRKTERRKNEIIAELTDLFAELDELDIKYYFGAPARNGGIDCYAMAGNVTLDEDEIIIS